MNIDIFIKTYPKDHEWLKYCLRSIYKFAKFGNGGFRRIVIVQEGDVQATPELVAFGEGRIIIHTLPIVASDSRYKDRVSLGYQHQKGIKCIWPAFTNADAVVQLDSDMILTGEFTPDLFFKDGKPKWWYRHWADCSQAEVDAWFAGAKWFQNGVPPVKHYMVAPGFVLTKELTNKFTNLISGTFKLDAIQFYSSLSFPHLSEYMCLGYVAERFLPDHYEFIEIGEGTGLPIIQFWSWGGLKEEIIEKIEAVLEA